MPKIWLEREMPAHLMPLFDGFEILGPADATPDDPFAAIADADGIIASILRYDDSVFARAPKLKVLARTGIGYDAVDVAAATAHKIAVCNTPDGPTISTAEHAVMLMLAAAKNLKQAERRLREGAQDAYKDHTAVELFDRVLGLVGLGRIARRVGRVALALGMRVLAYDPYVHDAPPGIALVATLDELLAEADVVSLHVPATPETRRMMNADRFAQMKRGAIFINTARGALVDEAALIHALESGHLFAAGLDVTDPEPAPPDHPLLHMENVIVTPHVASGTTTGKDRIYRMAIAQVVQVLRGERPPHLVNPEVWG